MPAKETRILLTYPKGTTSKCYNNLEGWFGHIRDHKPHLFFRWGQWYVVNAGSSLDHLKLTIHKKNSAAYLWACVQNATPEERERLICRMQKNRLEMFRNELKASER